MADKLQLTTGKSRLSARLTRVNASWDKLAKKLQRYSIIEHKYDDYMALPMDQQSSLKDVGFFVGGRFSGPKRLQSEMVSRCCIALDLDHLDSWDIDAVIDAYEGIEYVCHSTAKHDDDTPRLRIVFPLDREITPDEYEPVARRVASQVGMDLFDDTSFQPARIMYWPSVCIDRTPLCWLNRGERISADKLIDSYDDITDFGEWPVSRRAGKLRKPVKQAEDPLTKPGVIGAFNRTYDIHAAIVEFDLPYSPTEFENRYTPEGSSGAAGAISYDDVFLYSHHESDVAAQNLCNAFDLVRLHRFHERVAKESDDTPMGERPSFRAMSQLAISSAAVRQEIHAEEVAAMNTIPDAKSKANGVDPNPDQVMITFADLRTQINTIKDADDAERACDSMIPRIAAAKLNKSETARLAGYLRAEYPVPLPPRQALIDDIKEYGKQLAGHIATDGVLADMELELVDAVLDEHYESGTTIKRVARMWWTYDTGLWSIDSPERIDANTVKTVARLRVERPDEMSALVATVEEGRTSDWMARLSRLQAAVMAGKEDKTDPLKLMRSYPTPIINTLDSELWFDFDGNMKRKHHNPVNFFTTRINAAYDKKAKCPEWDRFVRLIFNECQDTDEMVRHLEELGGYIINMSRWLKTWVLFHGPKDTGKSTVAEVFKALLGDSFLGYDLGQFSRGRANQFTNSALLGKLALVDDDYEKGAMLPDGFIKKISEEKSMSSEKKWGDVFQFTSRALPIICSNHWPKTSDLSDAIRERALVFPFLHRISGADRSDIARDRMMDELPGILNRFVAGLVRLRARGNWDIPDDCGDARNMWVQQSNIAALFVAERIHVDGISRMTDVDAWAEFQLWYREETGHSVSGGRGTIGRNTFYQNLEYLLGDRIKISGRRKAFLGCQLIGSTLSDEMSNEDDVDEWDK